MSQTDLAGEGKWARLEALRELEVIVEELAEIALFVACIAGPGGPLTDLGEPHAGSETEHAVGDGLIGAKLALARQGAAAHGI